jgi:hypothetical protein
VRQTIGIANKKLDGTFVVEGRAPAGGRTATLLMIDISEESARHD